MPPGPDSSKRPAPARRCAVLAGGAGSRLGGDKHLRELAGLPLGAWPLRAAAAAALEPVLVAKPGTSLEPLLAARPGTGVIREPEMPLHPLAGVLAALEELREPVVVCPCDTPHVPPDLLAELALSPATTAGTDSGPEPLIARWEPDARDDLRRALTAGMAAQRLVGELSMARLEVEPGLIANVNTEEELALSEARLRW